MSLWSEIHWTVPFIFPRASIPSTDVHPNAREWRAFPPRFWCANYIFLARQSWWISVFHFMAGPRASSPRVAIQWVLTWGNDLSMKLMMKVRCSSETTIRAHLSGLSLKLFNVKSWIKSRRGSLLSPILMAGYNGSFNIFSLKCLIVCHFLLVGFVYRVLSVEMTKVLSVLLLRGTSDCIARGALVFF